VVQEKGRRIILPSLSLGRLLFGLVEQGGDVADYLLRDVLRDGFRAPLGNLFEGVSRALMGVLAHEVADNEKDFADFNLVAPFEVIDELLLYPIDDSITDGEVIGEVDFDTEDFEEGAEVAFDAGLLCDPAREK
jgi:hypothetical protein